MPKILQLDEALINKIAAGEVIERPSSIVKELIENALDAGATQITVELEGSGKTMIRVSDNGCGMDQEDANRCVLRHATSKIATADDLFAIHTLGFRGEALASIAAVSQLSLVTKQPENMSGYNLVVEGGTTISSGILPAAQGSTLEVRNLFYNTPARKKFLKSDQMELRHIIKVVTHYALLHPLISFELLHESHQLIMSPRFDDPRENIAALWGVSVAKDLLELQYTDEYVQIHGFISKPHQSRNDKVQQTFFVNDRWIRNKELAKAAYEGYHSTLLMNKHPLFVLSLKVNPARIDVNVHPQKAEIRIDRQHYIDAAVATAIKETLKKHNLIPEFDFLFQQAPAPRYAFEPATQTVLAEPVSVYAGPIAVSGNDGTIQVEVAAVPKVYKLPQMRVLGQIHKTFFVAETPGGVVFIDQHVVQERVLYEKYMQQYMGKQVAVQTLMTPELLEVDLLQASQIGEFQSVLAALGFTVEPFGPGSFSLKTVPSIFGRTQSSELFFLVLSQLGSRTQVEHLQEEIITRMSCRASIKAGDDCTVAHLQKMLAELEACELPFHCPHGRTIFITMGVDELEKKFSRK